MSKAAELAKMGEVLTNGQIGGRRNLIINGAYQIAQRATSSTGQGASEGYKTVDRWNYTVGGTATAGRFTLTQDTSDAPTSEGFGFCTKFDCTTADTSIAAGEALIWRTKLEGGDLQGIKKGTSGAEEITLSFYAKGTAATYAVELHDEDNQRHNTQKFTITTSWQRFELTFAADTTGAFNNDQAASLGIAFYLHGGSDFTGGTFTSNTWASRTAANVAVGIDSFYSSTDNEFFITGVQLEVGSTATPFEHRSFSEEVALCKRYYEVDGHGSNNPNGWNFKSMPVKLAQVGNYIQGTKFAVEKRADPTIVIYSRNGTSGKVSEFATGSDAANNWSTNAQGVTGFHAVVRDSGTHSAGTGFEYGFTADAEL